MRKRKSQRGLTVQAIAGSHVVLLAMDMPRQLCPGHMGFAIHRTDHTDDESYWLRGSKTFMETDPKLADGSTYSTRDHPIQGFTWSDFTAKPGHSYTYRVEALSGPAQALTAFRTVEVAVTTETEVGGMHDVFFNRGAAASQEFARRFGADASLARAPDDDPRWAWLSRGALEAIEAFIARAQGAGWALRVAAYEFRLPAVALALKAAQERGVDVHILYDGCSNPPDSKGHVFPRDDNRATVDAAQLQLQSSERLTRPEVKSPPIAHNKFIVLLENGQPLAVLTGSTNLSKGAVFGQSNVVHVAEHKTVARDYLACWKLLAANTDHRLLRTALTARNPPPAGFPRRGTTCVFSPQSDVSALDWYAQLARETEGGLFMTFAFGMPAPFKESYRKGKAPLRYALMDQLLPSGIRAAGKAAAQAEMLAIRKRVENRIAVGNRIATNVFDRWVKETLTGLNTHVQYIHTKFMLLDPLGPHPVVITGSANFSEASTLANDENMLVIRGDRRVADIYLGEYMRLWNHYAFREWVASGSPGAPLAFKHLDVGDTWWTGYFGNSARSRQRAYFSGGVR
ncbi:MAG: phospholipase D-like domain-containing protein [Burkholderiaceae bacterium]